MSQAGISASSLPAVQEAGEVLALALQADGVKALARLSADRITDAAAAAAVANLTPMVTAASAGLVQASTWAALAATNGARPMQPGRVAGDDAGQHVDPVTGATVDNPGEYAWSAAPAGWARVADLPIGLSWEYARSGWAYAVVDEAYRVLVGSAAGAPATSGESAEYARSGYIYAVIDQAYRVVVGSRGASAAASPAQALDDYCVFVAPVDGHSQVFIQSTMTGITTRLSSPGSNNFDPVWDPNARIVRWTSDRAGDVPPGSMWWSSPDAPAEQPWIAISSKVHCLGDSMSTESYMDELSALTGLTCISGGVPGQTSSQIVARQGSAPALMTVSGDKIPASGAVAVTMQSVSPITAGSANGLGQWLTLPGSLAGVPGVLSRDMSQPAGVDYLTFSRSSPGTETPCPPNTPFLPDTAGRDRLITIIWIGNNNPTQTSRVLADVEAAVKFLKARAKRYLVVGVINRPTAPAGSAEHAAVLALNAALAERWPQAFFDARAYLISHYNPGAPQDVADHAVDIVPRSLSDDNFHPNAAGQALLATKIKDLFTNKGWI